MNRIFQLDLCTSRYTGIFRFTRHKNSIKKILEKEQTQPNKFEGLSHSYRNFEHTRQIAGKEPPLIPITKIGIERRENNKNYFCSQTILKCELL